MMRTVQNSCFYILSFFLSPFLGAEVTLAQESICATVQIEIQQSLTFERQAFDAHMRVSNTLEAFSLDEVQVEVYFTDADGNQVIASSDPDNTDALFFITLDSLQNIDAVDGTGTIAPATKADAHWLIIPAPGSGGDSPLGTLYYVGATLSYTLEGKREVVEVVPDFIRVNPLPMLSLDYFLTRDVYADDPFTPEIEPSEPFTLGVRIRNNSNAAAGGLSIISAQPTIVENEQQLLIGFRIENSYIDDQPTAPTLLLDFGTIEPLSAKVGRWNLITNLSGEFTEFSAEFSHPDELGGALTSVIEDVTTHLLVHEVRVDLPGRDSVRDFLAMDGEVFRVYESQGLDTLVQDLSEGTSLTLVGNDGSRSIYDLSASSAVGFGFIQLTDPKQGEKVITGVTRSDGKRLPPENAWLSKVSLNNGGWNYFVNFFDVNTTGFYLVVFDDAPISANRKPVLQYIPDRQVEEGKQLAFVVEASDPEGVIPLLSASPLPFSAELLSKGDGTAVFDWTPAQGEAGEYEITFTASDGVLSTSQLVVLTVDEATNPVLVDYTIQLEEGYNLLAYPMAVSLQHSSCYGLLAAIGTLEQVASIEHYDPRTGLYSSCSYSGGDDFPIRAGESYEVRMYESKIVRFQGTQSCPRINLFPGLNMIGHPTPPDDMTCYSLLQYFGKNNVSSIGSFNSETGRFENCAWQIQDAAEKPVGLNFAIGIGKGLLVHGKTQGNLPQPGCD